LDSVLWFCWASFARSCAIRLSRESILFIDSEILA
jgi:hypothetical protein